MEEYTYSSTHPLGHTGPVTGSLYLFYIFIYYIYMGLRNGTAYLLSTDLRAFESRGLRIIFGPKRNEVNRGVKETT
jgi:hypothetical protein